MVLRIIYSFECDKRAIDNSNSANLQSCGCRLAIFVNEQNNKI